MHTRKNAPGHLVTTIVRELDAVRKRLDHAPEWIENGETIVSAAALAERIRLLSEEASGLSDPREVRELLRKVRKSLQDLEMLLGVH